MLGQGVRIVQALVAELQPHVSVIRAGSDGMGVKKNAGAPLLDSFLALHARYQCVDDLCHFSRSGFDGSGSSGF